MNTTTNILATLASELGSRDTAIINLTARRDELEAENATLRLRLAEIDTLAGGTTPVVTPPETPYLYEVNVSGGPISSSGLVTEDCIINGVPTTAGAGVNGYPIHQDSWHVGSCVYRLSTPVLAVDAPSPVTLEWTHLGEPAVSSHSWTAIIPEPVINP